MLIFSYSQDKLIEYTCFDEIIINGTKFCTINNKCYYYQQDETIKEIKLNKFIEIDNNYYLVMAIKYFKYNFDKKIIFSPFGDIKSSLYLEITNHQLLNPYKHFIYYNGTLTDADTIVLHQGDIINVEQIIFAYNLNYLTVFGQQLSNTTLKMFETIDLVDTKYQKSPRMFKQFSEDSIEIIKPPSNEKMNKNTIAKIIIPSLISMLTTVMMAIFTRRGLFVIVGIIATLCSLTYSIVTFLQEKKDMKKQYESRIQHYHQYLLDKRKALEKLYNNEIDVYNYNYPSVKEISEIINQYNSRIFERDLYDDDFINVSMGYYNTDPHYKLKFQNDNISCDKDDLIDDADKVYQKYKTVQNVKYHIDLKKYHLGLIGERKLAHQEIKRIILELTTFHSYYDLNIILLYHPQYAKEFNFTNWLKHCRLHDINVTTNISSNPIKEQVLASLYQILKQRSQQINEGKKDNTFKPHYILYIDDYNLINNHPIMEYLQNDDNLGITLIVRVNQYADLMSNIKTVFMLKDDYNIDLLMEDGVANRLRLLRDLSLKDVDYELLARNLSILEHQLTISSLIPDAVTFLEMYNVTNVEELNIYERWQSANIHKSISVPLGLRAKDDIVYLNLHEKAHGPHGLVAGTTGSGKSEIIQAYILSLVVNFSPYEVGFLLIDFKGGGMANLFKNLPHLIGTITNLDGAESMRALASIKSELKRRQQIFNEHDVNNINLYNKLFKAGEASEPLPHLFIISDEFAELKKEQPEFMDELVSVARIGRTLGVHLILATQKPTGVVNDQIWSNSKFKLALKVQNESDSKEIIKTPDAAFITQTGRAFLQVGNNEIYELFQSAWSGAPYASKEEVKDQVDNRVYLINKLGQEQLLNEDLSDEVEEAKVVTQLDVVVDYVNKIYQQHDYQPVKKAWLPSLENLIINPAMNIYQINDLSKIKDIALKSHIGLVDIPDHQRQDPYIVDFEKEPNLVVFGSSGYGKSFTLTSTIIDLCIKNNPELLYFYIIDLGNSGLIGLKNLVHVADYIGFDSLDKINKLINRIERIVNERKQLLANEAVQNINVYEQSLNTKLERIFIVIDNYDAVKETNEDLARFVEQVAQVGPSLGIYFIISATRSNAIKAAVLNSFKHRIVHYMNEASDMNMLVGRSMYPLNPSLKGRSLVKLNSVYQMQVYSMFKFDKLSEYNNQIKEFIEQINQTFTGVIPKPIPKLPDSFGSSTLKEYDYQDPNITKNIVGVSVSDVMQVGMLQLPPFLAVAGHAQSGKTNMLKLLISQMEYKPYVIDSKNMGFINYKDSDKVLYVNEEEGFRHFLTNMQNLIAKRKAECHQKLEQGEISSLSQYYNSLEPRVVFIDDIDDFITQYKDVTKLTTLFESGNEVGIKFVYGINAVASRAVCGAGDDLVKVIKSSNDLIVVGKLSTFNPLTLTSKMIPKFSFGVLCLDGELRSIKIPYYEEE